MTSRSRTAIVAMALAALLAAQVAGGLEIRGAKVVRGSVQVTRNVFTDGSVSVKIWSECNGIIPVPKEKAQLFLPYEGKVVRVVCGFDANGKLLPKAIESDAKDADKDKEKEKKKAQASNDKK